MRRLFLLSCALVLTSGADAWTLDGTTRIVVPARRADSAVWSALNESAEQFRGAVTERTGLRLEVVASDDLVTGKAVYLGARFARAAGFDVSAFRDWENAIVEKDGGVYLFGQEEHAGCPDVRSVGWAHCVLPSVRALTRFMETFLDVRFVMPGVVGMEVRPGTVVVPDGCNSRETPYLDYGAGHNCDPLGSIATQCFGAGDYRTYGGHLYPIACPMEKYAKSHPEYFGIVKGKRYCEWPWAKNGWAPLCFTNPEVEELIVQELLRQFDAGARVCQLAPGDSALYCECERCQNYGGLKDNPGTNHSEQLWLFHRHIAERIEKLRPGKVVHILSYGPTHHPPRDFKTFPSNVMIEVCEATEETLKLWRDFKVPQGLTTYVYLWGNYKLVGYTPRHSVRELAETARIFLKYGVHGIYRCGYGELWGLEGPGYYVFNRMLRDPQADVGATVDEFCTAAFGPAAKTMRRFYDTFDVRLDRIRPVAKASIDVSGGEGFMATFAKKANLAMLMKVWPEDVLAEMGRHLKAAEATEGLSVRQARRLKLVRLEYEYLVRLMRVIARYGTFRTNPCEATAVPLMDAVDARNALIDRLCDPKTGFARISDKWPELRMFSYASRDLLQHNGRSAGKIDEPLTLDTSAYRVAYDIARWKKAYAANPKLVRLTDWQRSPGHEEATVEITKGGKALHLVPAAGNHDVRVHCPFPAKPSTRYRLSWFLKLRDAKSLDPKGGAPGFAVIRNGNQRSESIHVDIPPLKVSTTDWMRQSVEFTTLDRPKIDAELSLRLYNASGEAWFEDVMLEEQ